uniref:Uncharacterized protein n=2 Tax=Oryza sativa subsp. japonica TaxID=39947 RepID=Q10E29_ORYSJ|nr:hypothetical protein [Oryza sativa Japonica Group]ABF99110.1 hypothetical protein LOC_Os03g56290 [Oryza sativa Japonica Group]
MSVQLTLLFFLLSPRLPSSSISPLLSPGDGEAAARGGRLPAGEEGAAQPGAACGGGLARRRGTGNEGEEGEGSSMGGGGFGEGLAAAGNSVVAGMEVRSARGGTGRSARRQQHRPGAVARQCAARKWHRGEESGRRRAEEGGKGSFTGRRWIGKAGAAVWRRGGWRRWGWRGWPAKVGMERMDRRGGEGRHEERLPRATPAQPCSAERRPTPAAVGMERCAALLPAAPWRTIASRAAGGGGGARAPLGDAAWGGGGGRVHWRRQWKGRGPARLRPTRRWRRARSSAREAMT